MAQVVFVEERDGDVVLDAFGDDLLSARAHLPGGVLGTIVRRRLEDWAAEGVPVRWEVLHRHGDKLRLADGSTTVTLDLVG